MFKLTGSVKLIKDTVQISEKFAKREFVVNDASSMYPQDILFQSVQDKCSICLTVIHVEEQMLRFLST